MTMRKHTFYRISITLAVVLAVCNVYQYSVVKKLKNTVENNYNRAFHELVSYVDDIDTLLQKSMLVSDTSQIAAISSELFRQTSAAKACLGQLPIADVQLENTEKFLSQIGDYTYTLSQSAIKEEQITQTDYENLNSLSEYASSLNKNLLQMQENIYSGTISFGTLKREVEKNMNTAVEAAGGSILSDFETVEKEFQEYPSLIYDGPFSEHIETLQPVLLENSTEVSRDEALALAKSFLGDRGTSLAYSGESSNSAIDCYSFSALEEDREIYISISKKGGMPVYFLDTENVETESISVDEAIKKGKEFLYSHGFTSLKESYYEKEANIATINFAYTQSDVICYSDLIKVKVALDDGKILGMEAHGYIMNHKHRNFGEMMLTADEARERINPNLAVTASATALIPKDSKKEVLCYEFKGNHNGRNFLIYINAENGHEEEILMLIESENGILTV